MNRYWIALLIISLVCIMPLGTSAENDAKGFEITYNGVPLEEVIGNAAEKFADAVEENMVQAIDGLNTVFDEFAKDLSESLGKIETEIKDVAFDYFCYSNSGASTDQIYSYEIERNEESGEWRTIVELYCGNIAYILPTEGELLEKVSAIIEEHKLHAWNGFNKNNSLVLDGSGFSLTVDFADGSGIHARGDNSFPEGFHEAKLAIDELFHAYLEKNGIDPEKID